MRHEGLIEPDLRGVIIAPEPMTDEEFEKFEVEVQRILDAMEHTFIAHLFTDPVITYNYEEENSEA